MGNRGAAPAPTAVKLRNGETRPSRINYEEPHPSGEPEKPLDLDEASEAVWDRVVRDAPVGMLTSLDTEVLRLYCEAVSRYVTAQIIYKRQPLLKRGWYISPDEDPNSPTFGKDIRQPMWTKNPMHQVVRDNGEQIRLLARELGFSPSARANLHITIAGGSGFPGMDDDLGPSARLRLLRDPTED